MTQIKHDTREHHEWKADLVETSRKVLERRTADILARTRDSMILPDPLDDDEGPLDFGQLIKNTDVN